MPPDERPSQYERTLRELRSLILSGEFEAGQHMSEVALAERLDASRTPLRQAMARLVDETLLERTRTGRCLVASFTMDDISDAIELRGVLEGTAARLAAERGITDEAATEGFEILAAIDDALLDGGRTDFDAYARLNSRFHELLSSLPGSRVIEREVERASRLPLASPNAFVEGQQAVPDFHASLRVAQRQHRAILDAIVAREGARAEALAREHARLARHNLDLLDQGRDRLAESVPGLALVVP